MTSKSDRKNMTHDENDYSDDDSVYSDVEDVIELDDEFDDVLNGDRDDSVYAQTEQDAELAQAEAEWVTSKKIENADTMTFIRLARVMPTQAEMEVEYKFMIAADAKSKMKAFGAILFTGWKKRFAVADAKHNDELIQQSRRDTLTKLKKIINPPYILTLSPRRDFEEEYKHMKMVESLLVSLVDRFATRNSRVDTIKRAVALRRINGKAGAARAIKRNTGMNKRTEWHAARSSGGLAFAGQETEKERDDRLKRKATAAARKADEKTKFSASCLALQSKIQVDNFTPKFIDLAETTEEDADEEDADEAMALLEIRQICVEKADARQQAEAEAEALAKTMAEEKAELDRFVKVLGKNTNNGKRLLIIQPIGLIAQKRIERCINDAKYAKRTEAFSELGDKNKLDQALKFTQMCSSLKTGKPCRHKDCRFAHSLDQLQRKECRFGLSCRFVKYESGLYKNTKFGRTGKTCSCMHPGETASNFGFRMGIKPISETPKVDTKPFKPMLSVLSTPKTAGCWATMVTKAEVKSVVADAKSKMLKQWTDIVFTPLTEGEKKTVYGKGAEIVTLQGFVDGTGLGKDSSGRLEPIMTEPNDIRKPWDKRGLGFAEPIQSTSSKVLTSGFNWVKGAVLTPEMVEVKIDPIVAIMEKVYTAVSKINKRVIELTVAKINKTVFKIPRRCAKKAIVSALRSGISDFRIEYDSDEDSSDSSECDVQLY
jgi:hypothetical protein